MAAAFLPPLSVPAAGRALAQRHTPLKRPVRRPRPATGRPFTFPSSCTGPPNPPPPPPPPPPEPEYSPSDDDKAELISDTPMELTLSQQLLYKQYAEQVDAMSVEEARSLAVEVIRQMMVKDNLVKRMLKDGMIQIDPPDPEPFLSDDDDDDDAQ